MSSFSLMTRSLSIRSWSFNAAAFSSSRMACPASQAPIIPLDPLLAVFFQAWKSTIPCCQLSGSVFASFGCQGRKPRTANMLVEDHLRPETATAGVLATDDARHFGFNNLRRGLVCTKN
jgi:hypothetical protein